MSLSTLLVPMQLDALHAMEELGVVRPSADFTQLPDRGNEGPYISEKLVEPEFQTAHLRLPAGIHLHWLLPEALARTWKLDQDPSTPAAFPAVPNRWLVVKNRGGNDERQWVVESDYLHPAGEGSKDDCIDFPALAESPPYRYLGRRMPLEDWRRDGDKGTYLRDPSNPSTGRSRLTAIGYGEPTFAAFYPNCRSVFGFHDPSVHSDADLEDLRYEVLGWYSEPADDFLQAFIERKKRDGTAALGKAAAKELPKLLLEAVREDLRWTFPGAEELDPQSTYRLLCSARLTFQPDGTDGQEAQGQIEAVALGNTGSEALTAYLARELGQDDAERDRAEEALEAILLAEDLAQARLDLGPRFRNARHEKSFNALDAGSVWTIEASAEHAAGPAQASAARRARVPAKFAAPLDELHRAQQDYDRAREEIASLRQQLFSDWYEYQKARYHQRIDDGGFDEGDAEEFDTGDDDEYEDAVTGGYQGIHADPDEIRVFIERVGLAELEERVGATGELRVELDKTTGFVTRATADRDTEAGVPTKAGLLAKGISGLLSSITEHNAQAAGDGPGKDKPVALALNQISSPRFWQPKEPVVLLVGTGTQQGRSDFRDVDGRLECRLRNLAWRGHLSADELGPVWAEAGQLAAANTWSHQPWHPFLLEWDVDFFPLERQGDIYPDTFISGNYTLNENAADLEPPKRKTLATAPGKSHDPEVGRVYQGSCILTPHAGQLLRIKLEKYVEAAMLADHARFLASLPEPETPSETGLKKRILEQVDPTYATASGRPDHDFAARIGEVIEKYHWQSQTVEAGYAVSAYRKVTGPGFHALSQALGGVNAALLLHKQTLQLPVDDPLDPAAKAFVERVRSGVAESNDWAPTPVGAFNPIRAGVLTVDRLRLIDTFGQFRELPSDQLPLEDLITPVQAERDPDDRKRVWLPPRLVQPARINFRWLAATPGEAGEDRDSNDATSPLCGWVLPNFLDNSLAIYDAAGKALGAITTEDRDDVKDGWAPAPGGGGTAEPTDIGNPYLKRTVMEILETVKVDKDDADQDDNFLQQLLVILQNALENIDPESFAQHQSLALLCGRPLAVVRASLSLELQGRPAVDRGELAFKADVERWSAKPEDASLARTTQAFAGVRFPVRIGEFQQLNDGLVGYWLEENGDFADHKFYAPQSTGEESLYIETRAENLVRPDQPRAVDRRGAAEADRAARSARGGACDLRHPAGQIAADSAGAVRRRAGGHRGGLRGLPRPHRRGAAAPAALRAAWVCLVVAGQERRRRWLDRDRHPGHCRAAGLPEPLPRAAGETPRRGEPLAAFDRGRGVAPSAPGPGGRRRGGGRHTVSGPGRGEASSSEVGEPVHRAPGRGRADPAQRPGADPSGPGRSRFRRTAGAARRLAGARPTGTGLTTKSLADGQRFRAETTKEITQMSHDSTRRLPIVIGALLLLTLLPAASQAAARPECSGSENNKIGSLGFHASFVGSSTILNDGNANDALTLRVANIADYLGKPTVFTIQPATRFEIWFDADPGRPSGDDYELPWTLLPSGSLKKIKIDPAPEIMTEFDVHKPNIDAGEYTWIIQAPRMLELKPGEYKDFLVHLPTTLAPSGLTPLFFETVNIEVEGKTHCSKLKLDAIEKGPIVYRDHQVGIGTTDPKAKLDVAGNVRISGGESTLSLEKNVSQGKRMAKNLAFTDDVGNLRLETTATEDDLVLQTGILTGKVGIGTSQPNAKLDVNGDTVISGTLSVGVKPNQVELSNRLLEDGGAGTLVVNKDARFGGTVRDSHGFVTPAGGILMYAGPRDNFDETGAGKPGTEVEGWVLCNGENDTPNLQGRFVVGAGGDYELGVTGGSAATTLTTEQLPAHRHQYSYPNWAADASDGGGGSGGWNNAFTGIQTTATGDSKPIDNRPPFYAVFFIMKRR